MFTIKAISKKLKNNESLTLEKIEREGERVFTSESYIEDGKYTNDFIYILKDGVIIITKSKGEYIGFELREDTENVYTQYGVDYRLK